MVPSPAPTSTISPWRTAALAAVVLAWFAWFTRGTLQVDFAADDMMNIFEYWRHGPFRLVYSQFMFWHDFYRPMGGIFYYPLFSAFGLNPAPFHAVQLGLMLVNTGLVYRLGRLLGAAGVAAWFAAVIVAYHEGLGNLYFNTSFIYDVLCSVFFLAALVTYIGPRSQDRWLRPREVATFFLLYLCALNSKEMAVTLPLVILAYEWLYHRAGLRPRIAITAAAVALPYIYSRVLGAGGIVHNSGYGLDLSPGRVLAFQQDAIRDLLILPVDIGWKTLISLWTAITYFAWRSDRPALRFCWILMLVTPLPVEFLEGRRAAVLAIPLAGWALFAGILLAQAASALVPRLDGEPGFRRLSHPMRLALILGYLLFLWGAHNQWAKRTGGLTDMAQTGELTAHVIDQFRQLHPRVRPRTAVTFLNDPFDAWDMYFIAQLWFRDRTINIKLQKKTPEPLDTFNSIFDYRDGKLIQVK